MGKLLTALMVLVVGFAGPAASKTLEDGTYEELTEPQITHSFAVGLMVGALLIAPISCPSMVTAGVLRAHMSARIANGVNKPTDLWLVVFYGAAADAGCVSDLPTQPTRKPNT